MRTLLCTKSDIASNLLESPTWDQKTESLIQCLEKQEGLYELHTHLLGMGNASFWVQNILADRIKLPTHNDFINDPDLRRKLGPLVWKSSKRAFMQPKDSAQYFDELLSKYDSKPTAYKFDALYCNFESEEFCDKIEHHKLTFKENFSYDVVFSLENLAKGLGLEEDQPRDIKQSKVEEKLGIYTKSGLSEVRFFNYWIIFNAREQHLQVVYGMQAEKLRMLIGGVKPIDQLTDPAQRDARAHIINAFSMMNADGSEPRSIDFHSFRGAFTPEFYPRRFVLKDSIYAQRLDLLAYLLRYVLRRYATCLPPVKYCEFSVGCGDLSRPWVFDVLSTFAKSEQLTGTFKTLVDRDCFPWLKTTDIEKNIEYCFLVGFDRGIPPITNAYRADEAILLLFDAPHYGIHVMLREFYLSDSSKPTIIFTRQVEKLMKLEEEIESNPHFFDWVVGLDLCGDEVGHPYCPFVAHEFIRFVKEARKQNSNFGVRIHSAENVPFIGPELPGYRLFAAHMYILYRCIDFLKRRLKSNIRIGHGIGFDKLLSIKNYKYRKSSVLVAEMQSTAKSVLKSIPFEVNITSNFYLLGDAIRNVHKEKPLSHLYEIGVSVILSTDDDGIWPIDKCALEHQSHHSLAGEYCKAITSQFITEDKWLKKMIRNSKKFRFHQENSLAEKNKFDASINENSKDTQYFTTEVLAHPNVLHTLFNKKQSSQEENACLKYYKSRYGSEKLLEPVDEHGVKPDYEIFMQILTACFYLTRSLGYEGFEKEIKFLCGCPDRSSNSTHASSSSPWCKKIYNACENVYSQLMRDTPDEGASMKVNVDGKSYLFCSEKLDNREGISDFFLNTIKDFIRQDHKAGTVFSFLSNIDENNQKTKRNLKNLAETIKDKSIETYIYTNTKKHLTLLNLRHGNLFINSEPNRRTDVEQGLIEHILLYAVCPHGSVATSALHFIAKHIYEEDFRIEPQHVDLSSLMVPFLPLRFGYPPRLNQTEAADIKSLFLKTYCIENTTLAEKIEIQEYSVCKPLYDPKYNLLCADVRYAKQIDTKDLLDAEDVKKSITENNDKLLKILVALCKSIRSFNVCPKSFVILENIHDFESYRKDFENDNIAVPIIQIKRKLLICSNTVFFEKNSESYADLLWALAVGWNPPLNSGNNPYEYPYSTWIKSILEIGRNKLNQQLGKRTWENFLTEALFDAGKRAWHWYSIGSWCDVIEEAFIEEGNLKAFVKFLKTTNKYKDFIELVKDVNRHKIGNPWQMNIIRSRQAKKYLQKIDPTLVS